jgi:hypothetical protein
MLTRKLGTLFFFAGIFLMVVHTTLPFIWNLVGIKSPYPLISDSVIGTFLPGFTPVIGAFLMMMGGYLYGRKPKELK